MNKISIIIPVFNRQHIISDTLESVQRQIYENWECLLVDDGSTDNVGAVIAKYVEKDKRFKYFKRPALRPKGPSACRNYGMENAVGDFYLFLDSDDMLAEICLKNRLLAILENPEQDFVVFSMGTFNKVGHTKIDPNNAVFQGNALETLKRFFTHSYPWNTTRPLYRKQIIEKVGGFNEQLMVLEDPDMAKRILKIDDISYKTIDVVDCYYRLDNTQKEKFKSIVHKNKHLESYLIMYQSLFRNFTDADIVELTSSMKYNLIKFLSINFAKRSKPQLLEVINLFKKHVRFSALELISIRVLLEININNRPKGTHRIVKKIQNTFKRKAIPQSSSKHFGV